MPFLTEEVRVTSMMHEDPKQCHLWIKVCFLFPRLQQAGREGGGGVPNSKFSAGRER